MLQRMLTLLLTLVLLAGGAAGCAKPPAPPPDASSPPEATAPPEPPLPAALARPDLSQPRPLVLTPLPAPASDGPPLDLWPIAFVTTESGFGAGATGAIYRTDDGGRSWRTISRHDGVRFSRLLFPSDQVGWALGYTGCDERGEGCKGLVIVRTADGGQSWQSTPTKGLPGPSDYRAGDMQYQILSPDLAYAAASNLLLATRDGGQHWHPVPLPEGVTPTGGLYFRTPERGYVTGSVPPSQSGGKYPAPRDSVLLATTDGGKSWQSLYRGTVPLRSVYFLDEKQGFIGGGFHHYRVGPVSRILLATADGGATWEERNQADLFFQDEAPFTRLSFSSPSYGWAEQEHGPAVYTTDGGRTWSRFMSDRFLGGLAVVGSHVWSRQGGYDAFLLHSADAGQSWETLYQRGALLPEKVQFISPKVGWLATDPIILKTVDGGESWVDTGMISPTSLFSAPHFITEQVAVRYVEERGWLGGRLERSVDGGKRWQHAHGDVVHPRFSFVSPTVGYMANPDRKSGPDAPYPDRLMRTNNGGESWITLPAQLPPNSFIAFADEMHGAAVGGYPEPKLMVTGDGGLNWLTLDLGKYWVCSLDYTRGGHIWLAMTEEEAPRRGLLLHSPDRGASWEVNEVAGTGENLVQVEFASPDEGWLIARLSRPGSRIGDAVLARTRDGGKTWAVTQP